MKTTINKIWDDSCPYMLKFFPKIEKCVIYVEIKTSIGRFYSKFYKSGESLLGG